MKTDIASIGCEKISLVKDPFNKESIMSIYVRSSNSFGRIRHHGNVEFQNGGTKGEQSFNGDSFDSVVIQIRNFIDTL